MPSISELLGNPLTDVLKGASDIIGRFVADPTAKLQASQELAKLQSDFQSKLLDADTAFVQAQAQVITAEAKSDSWLTRNWRPIMMLTFVFIIAYNFVIAQLLHLQHIDPTPDGMWTLLEIGMGGYVMGRSAEKIADSLAPASAAKKDSP